MKTGRVWRHRGKPELWKPGLPDGRETNVAEVRQVRIISWLRVRPFAGTYHTAYVLLQNVHKHLLHFIQDF